MPATTTSADPQQLLRILTHHMVYIADQSRLLNPNVAKDRLVEGALHYWRSEALFHRMVLPGLEQLPFYTHHSTDPEARYPGIATRQALLADPANKFLAPEQCSRCQHYKRRANLHKNVCLDCRPERMSALLATNPSSMSKEWRGENHEKNRYRCGDSSSPSASLDIYTVHSHLKYEFPAAGMLGHDLVPQLQMHEFLDNSQSSQIYRSSPPEDYPMGSQKYFEDCKFMDWTNDEAMQHAKSTKNNSRFLGHPSKIVQDEEHSADLLDCETVGQARNSRTSRTASREVGFSQCPINSFLETDFEASDEQIAEPPTSLVQQKCLWCDDPSGHDGLGDACFIEKSFGDPYFNPWRKDNLENHGAESVPQLSR